MNNIEIGLKYLSKDNFEKAEYHFTQAISEDNLNAEAFYNRGRVFRLKGNYIAAINDFEKVLEINPDRKDAAVAIDMMKSIISFRNPDLMNH